MAELPATAALLLQGGDQRLEVAGSAQINRYGCQPFPAAQRIGFGSSTATQISDEAFQQSDLLWQRIQSMLASSAADSAAHPQSSPQAADIYKTELERIRTGFTALCGIAPDSAPDMIFAASGTDAHLIAARLFRRDGGPRRRVILVGAEESGSGVPAALEGKSRSLYTALGEVAAEEEEVDGDVQQVAIRDAYGTPRTVAAIDAEVAGLTEASVAQGFPVLLVLVDVSKTGCIFPSPQCVRTLQQRWPEYVTVLVDACQFRMEMAALRVYLRDSFLVAVTGSKFIGGPSFSAALLVPQALAVAMRQYGAPAALAPYCAREEWPAGWNADATLPSHANFGLLLRWQAALTELQAFLLLPAAHIRNTVQQFAAALLARLLDDPHFSPLVHAAIPGRAVAEAPLWDDLPTIHAFTLHRISPSRAQLTAAGTLAVYRCLQQQHGNDGQAYIVGQPVACGLVDGLAASALRISLSARLIVRAYRGDAPDGGGDAGIRNLIAQAMACLDTIAALIDTSTE